MTTILQQCLELTRAERLNIIAELSRSLRDEEAEQGDQNTKDMARADTLCLAIGNVIGQDIKGDRTDRMVWARTMVAYQLRTEGYTLHQIGDMLGKNHATISYLCSKMSEALEYPVIFKDVNEIWKRFQTKIKTI